jgi:hypothetical protein
MKNRVIPSLLGALFVLTPQSGQAQNGAWLSASIPYITLRVQVSYNYAGVPKIVEEFSTNDPDNHSVFCLSSFFDVKYELRNASNKVIALDSKPWEHGTDIIQGGGGNVAGAPDACRTVKASRVTRAVLLSYFYPSLPLGTYTLQITLAPRGRSDRAAVAPFTIRTYSGG